jgi:predicted RNA binding protein YcfA (HicA-like mRNA interferase family)
VNSDQASGEGSRGGKKKSRDFPSMRGSALMRVLRRSPLLYRVTRQVGSHRWLRSSRGYPPVLFSWHDQAEIPGWTVKKVLVDQVGLSEEDALSLL